MLLLPLVQVLLVAEGFLVNLLALALLSPKLALILLVPPDQAHDLFGAPARPYLLLLNLDTLLLVLLLQPPVLSTLHFVVFALNQPLPKLPLDHRRISIVVLPLQLHFFELFRQPHALFLLEPLLLNDELVNLLLSLLLRLLLSQLNALPFLLLLTPLPPFQLFPPLSRLLNFLRILHQQQRLLLSQSQPGLTFTLQI